MADDSKNVPDGLDEFLTSDDPQGDRAAQGIVQIANSAPVQQALNVGQNLDNYNNMLQAAIVGDQAAGEALAAHSAGIAMGTLKTPPNAKPFGTVANDIKQGPNYQPGIGKTTSTEIPKQTNFGKVKIAEEPSMVDYGKVIRKADGGEITPAGLDEFINSPSTQPMVANPAENQTQSPQMMTNQPEMSSSNMTEPHGLDEFVHDEMLQQKHGSLGQQAITGLEGAGRGILGPIAPALEQSFGIDPEAIRGRQEANPMTHMAGEALGLGASMLTGVGEGALLAKAGEGAAALAGLGEASNIAKIGSAAVKGSIENMIYSGSDEMSKFILSEPSQSAQSALIDVGLSGLIGGTVSGAIGAVNPLWKATAGPKVHEALNYISEKLGGIEGQLPDAVSEAIAASGMEIAPEIKAGLSKDPHLQHMYATLQESGSKSGIQAQEIAKNFRRQASEAITETLGKTPKEIEALHDLSDFDAGTNVKKALSKELKETIDPIAEEFDKIRTKYAGVELKPETTNGIANNISEMVAKEGYNLSPSSPQSKLVSNILKELPNLETLEDLRKYQSIVGDNTYGNPELRRVGGQIKSILRTAEDNSVLAAAGEKAPGAIAEHAAAREAYSKAMTSIDSLNDRLHVGSYSGPKSFIKALGEMAPEDVLRRLSPKSDASLITELEGKFPNSSRNVKDYYLSQALKTSAQKAENGELISAKSFLKSLDKMSPEMKRYLVDDQSLVKISAIDKLIDSLPNKMNPSGTAKTLSALFDHMPASAGAVSAMLLGHGPVAAVMAGALGKALGRDIPDAIKLGVLKFMGSAQPINAGAFKSAVDLIHNMAKGEKALTKASKEAFNFEAVGKNQNFTPDFNDIAKLEKMLDKLAANPSSMQNVANDVHHYMPEHGMNLSKTAAGAVNYLNTLRPNTAAQAPLDSKMPVNAVQQAIYHQALHIAQQPLVVIEKITSGRLVPQDVVSLQTMYPDLYNRMSATLTNDLTNTVSKGKQVPYTTRIGLSMFLGQALDSTLTSQGINNAQPKPPEQQQPQQNQAPTAKKSANSLNKLSQSYMTPSQARAAHSQKD